MREGKKRFLKKLLGKSFFLELADALVYPSSAVICEVIEKYTAESKGKLEFESKVSPVTFYLENTPYQANIKMACGEYYINCSEA